MSLLAVLALLTACQTRAPVTAPAGDGTCGTSLHEGLVGRRPDAARLPAGPDVRIVGPDTIVTMDFRPDRLNIATGPDGTISRVYCG